MVEAKPVVFVEEKEHRKHHLNQVKQPCLSMTYL